MPRLTLSVLEQRVGVSFGDRETGRLLEAVYGDLTTDSRSDALQFRVERPAREAPGAGSTRIVSWAAGRGFRADDDGEFLVELEAALTIELQKLRPDLFFVHSAVLENDGSAIMLAGQPGSGKSTTCWALLHRGFRYLSDELGPIDLDALCVLPYSRAVVLKRDPPASFEVPASALRTSRTIHIPVSKLPASAVDRPVPLKTIIFLNYRGPGHEASLEPIGGARAGAHLYTHALNALAHPGEGLDATIRITGRARCYELVSSNLEDSCSLIAGALAGSQDGAPAPLRS